MHEAIAIDKGNGVATDAQVLVDISAPEEGIEELTGLAAHKAFGRHEENIGERKFEFTDGDRVDVSKEKGSHECSRRAEFSRRCATVEIVKISEFPVPLHEGVVGVVVNGAPGLGTVGQTRCIAREVGRA